MFVAVIYKKKRTVRNLSVTKFNEDKTEHEKRKSE